MITKGLKINDRYQIIKNIGEGGMANVYLAHDIILNRDVAVKVLRGDLAEDDKFVRRFQREAISSSSLKHPNIVEMYDVGEDNGTYYIVMEYVPGKTLKNLIKRRGALTIPEVVDIMLQLTDGIKEAHNSYIIHRDLKPQNVMILDNGIVKITDFGIAMALNSNELTQTNSVMGSVHYLPPEQANGSGSTIKSDIYSLGILMYELLTGQLPFRGDNAVEIAIKHMKEPLPSIIAKNPTIPQSIENIILKACAKNPMNRYDDIIDMHNDLKTALNIENINAPKVVYKFNEDIRDDNFSSTKVFKEGDVTIDKKKNKGNKSIIIMTSIIIILIISILTLFVMLPKMLRVPDIKVPNVKGLSIIEAETVLKNAGFVISEPYKEETTDEVETGKVFKTQPTSESVRKKGTAVTLYLAAKKEAIKLEDYKKRNYLEVKAFLEAKGLYVLVEKRTIQEKDKDKYKENEILEQKPPKDTELVEKDTVTLYIADIELEYPDFVLEKWNIDGIKEFCTKHKLNLTIEDDYNTNAVPGTVISQSRPAKSKIIVGAPIKIVVAKKQEAPDVPNNSDISINPVEPVNPSTGSVGN